MSHNARQLLRNLARISVDISFVTFSYPFCELSMTSALAIARPSAGRVSLPFRSDKRDRNRVARGRRDPVGPASKMAGPSPTLCSKIAAGSVASPLGTITPQKIFGKAVQLRRLSVVCLCYEKG